MKIKMNSIIIGSALFSIFFMSSCASINSVSLTQIPQERNQKVKAVKDKIIFLGFNFDNDFVDQMSTELQRQCPNGRITGILTKDENINYFLYIVWKKQVSAEGYCQRIGALPGATNKKKSAQVNPELRQFMGEKGESFDSQTVTTTVE